MGKIANKGGTANNFVKVRFRPFVFWEEICFFMLFYNVGMTLRKRQHFLYEYNIQAYGNIAGRFYSSRKTGVKHNNGWDRATAPTNKTKLCN